MQEGLKKIIEDATSIEGDGFENMDMVIDTLVLTNTTISCIIYIIKIKTLYQNDFYITGTIIINIFRYNILPSFIELIKML